MYTVKNQLADAIIRLSKTRRLEKITVVDICRETDVVKQTFYNHFRDKYDLIAWIFTSDVSNFDSEGTENYSIGAFRASFVKLWEKRAFYNLAFQLDAQNSLENYIVRRVVEKNTQFVQGSSPGDPLTDEAALAILYHAHGTYACVQSWLQGAYDITPADFADMMYRGLPETLKIAWRTSKRL